MNLSGDIELKQKKFHKLNGNRLFWITRKGQKCLQNAQITLNKLQPGQGTSIVCKTRQLRITKYWIYGGIKLDGLDEQEKRFVKKNSVKYALNPIKYINELNNLSNKYLKQTKINKHRGSRSGGFNIPYKIGKCILFKQRPQLAMELEKKLILKKTKNGYGYIILQPNLMHSILKIVQTRDKAKNYNSLMHKIPVLDLT